MPQKQKQTDRYKKLKVLAGAAGFMTSFLPLYLESIRRNPQQATALAVRNVAHATGIVPNVVHRIASEMGKILSSHSIGGVLFTERSASSTAPGVLAAWVPGGNVKAVYIKDLVRVISTVLFRYQQDSKTALDVTPTAMETALVPVDFFQQKKAAQAQGPDVLTAIIAVLFALFLVSILGRKKIPKREEVELTQVDLDDLMATGAPATIRKILHDVVQTGPVSIDPQMVTPDNIADILVGISSQYVDTLAVFNESSENHCLSLVKAISRSNNLDVSEAISRLQELHQNDSLAKTKISTNKARLQKLARIVNRGLAVLTGNKREVRHSVARFLYHVSNGSSVAKNIFIHNIDDHETRKLLNEMQDNKTAHDEYLADYVTKMGYLVVVKQYMKDHEETSNYWDQPACSSTIMNRAVRTITRVQVLLQTSSSENTLQKNHGPKPNDLVRVIAYLVGVYSSDINKYRHGISSNKSNSGKVYETKYQIDRCYAAVLAIALLYAIDHEVHISDIGTVIDAFTNHESAIIRFLGQVARWNFEK